MFDPERRAALRKRAESHARKIEAGLQDGVPTTGYLTLTPADVLDLLAALEAAEQAIRAALAAAEAERIDRYRGTDERREFVRILYGALEGAESE